MFPYFGIQSEHVSNDRYQEYIRDKSAQPHILACITTFLENDVRSKTSCVRMVTISIFSSPCPRVTFYDVISAKCR